MNFDLVNCLLAIAGLGTLAAAITHTILGERMFVGPIISRMDWSNLPLNPHFARQITRLAWHVTSLMWLTFSVIFLAPVFNFSGTQPIYVIATAAFAGALIMTGPMTRWRHRGWPIFAVITLSLGGASIF